VPPTIAPMGSACEAVRAPPDVAVADGDEDVDDMVVDVVEVVVVVVVEVVIGSVLVGVVSGTVDCKEPEGPIPTKSVVEVRDIHWSRRED